METSTLQVQMLGEFSIRQGSAEINDGANRSRKVWLLLAYMIYCRTRPVTPEELITLLWGEEEKSSNPANAIKTMFHRVRACLDQLGSNVGHELIIRRNGGYAWNPNTPLSVDVDEFERLCKAGYAAQTESEKLDSWLSALNLYQGNFLSKLSYEPWVVPISAYFHNLYIQVVLEVLPILTKQERWNDIITLCRNAVSHEPYLEELYRNLMFAQLQMGDQQAAVTVYENMSELLLSDCGIMPCEDVRILYRQAIRAVNDHALSPSVILEQLRESSDIGGALLCTYDFFQAIYQSVARSVERSGDAVHLAIISVTDSCNRELPKRSLSRVICNLKEIIRSGLRRGDVVSQCSVSQFILLLPQANYESACMVCSRITKAFNRQYPHSPAQLHTSVHALEPNLPQQQSG